MPIVAKHFLAARGGGEFGFGNVPAMVDLACFAGLDMDRKSGFEMIGLVEELTSRGQWVVFVFHQIHGSRLTVGSYDFNMLLNYLHRLLALTSGRRPPSRSPGRSPTFRPPRGRAESRLSTAFQKSVWTSEMLYGAGGLEGRERPSKGLQRKDATNRSVLERHRGEAPVEVQHFASPVGLAKCCTKSGRFSSIRAASSTGPLALPACFEYDKERPSVTESRGAA